MKPIRKKSAIILTIVISIIIAIGALFTFVPMAFGRTSFLSFAGNVKIAGDLKPGMYGEYVIEGNQSSENIDKSVSGIKTILAEYGFTNANVYAVDNSKVRVEIARPTSGNYSDAQDILSAIDAGVFELRTGTDADDMFILGSEHITDVSLGNSSGTTFVKITFNNDGVANYRANMVSGNTIYVYLGGNLQTSFSASTAATDELYLTFNEYASANRFKMAVKLGSLPVSYNADLTEINTMSPTLSTTGLTADINSAYYAKSDIFILLVLTLTFCVLASFVFLIVKYRAFGFATMISVLVQSIISLILMQALTAVELSLSGMLVLAGGYALSIFGSYYYICHVESEFKEGKTLSASLESGYKKSIAVNATIAIALVVFGAVMAIFGAGAILTAGILIVIFGALGGLGNLVLLPFFMKIYHAMNPKKIGAYGLVREGDTNEKA